MYLVNESSNLESVNRVHEIGEKSHSLLDHPRNKIVMTTRALTLLRKYVTSLTMSVTTMLIFTGNMST